MENEFPPILTKAQFVRAYQAGLFGNRAPTWNSLDDFLRSKYVGLVHVRNRTAGATTWYDIPSQEVDRFVQHLLERGSINSLGQVYFSGMAPTDKTVLQGEIRQSENHLDLFFSRVRKPMRASLLDGGKQVKGIVALGLLKSYLDPPSYDWMNVLLDRYPGHVLEFSTYSTRWGTLNLNTVWWETRLY